MKKKRKAAEGIELERYGSFGWEATTVPRRHRRPSEKYYIIYSSGKEVGTNKKLIAEKRRRATIFDISVLLHYWVVTEDPRAVKTVKHRTFQKTIFQFNTELYCCLVTIIVQRKQHSKTVHGRPLFPAGIWTSLDRKL